MSALRPFLDKMRVTRVQVGAEPKNGQQTFSVLKGGRWGFFLRDPPTPKKSFAFKRFTDWLLPCNIALLPHSSEGNADSGGICIVCCQLCCNVTTFA